MYLATCIVAQKEPSLWIWRKQYELGSPAHDGRVRCEGLGVLKTAPRLQSKRMPRRAKNSNIILTLARIIRRKGHDTVIKCLPSLIQKFPNIQYVIAGPHRKKDTYLDELKLLAKELSVENHLIFIDYIPESDLNEIYSRSQVYIMVSRTYNDIGDSEGFGITFLEANACGCPVIGSTEGGIPDAVENNKNGLLVPADDIKSLTKAIDKFLEDQSFRRKIIDQGIERVNNDFTWEKLTIKMVKYLSDIKN